MAEKREESSGHQPPKRKPKITGIVGVGLDGDDGQTRITRGKNFVLWGGSQDTHGMMQETAIKVNESLDRRGKQLQDVSPSELREIFHEVTDSMGMRREGE
ncbi:MAG: hypothetical protein ACUVTW_00610 [Thermogutta sp.]